jgi:hypothetical protein
VKQRNNLIILSFVLSATLGISLFAQSYGVPSPISAYDVAAWANRGGFIASGSAVPSAVASEGALYIDNTAATQPVLYRYGSGSWAVVAGGGSGGVSTHSQLLGLSFAESGHTGFASESALNDHIADQIDPHGATMTVSQELTIGDPTATDSACIDSPATGVVRIASNVAIVANPEHADNAAAITAGLATGTLYHDASGVVRIVY